MPSCFFRSLAKPSHVLCRRCHRPLRNPESVQLGIGPVCLAKELGRERKVRQHNDPAYPKLLEIEK
jgi:hypothetical protein